VIVSVEGRRLLLGLTPTTMSLVAELPSAALGQPPAASAEARS
jgi:flagellar biogenesis protein FliO